MPQSTPNLSMSLARLDSLEGFFSSPPSSPDPFALSRTSFTENLNFCVSREDHRDKLKEEYLAALRSLSATTAKLRQTVLSLLKIHIKPHELLSWGVQAGFDELRLRKILSELLLDLGIRRRRSGAGPRIPNEALFLFAYAKDHYGERALKLLRAACRAARAEKKNQLTPLIPIQDKPHANQLEH